MYGRFALLDHSLLERAESSESWKLIGSESRRYFTMLPAYHPRRPRGGQSGRDKRRNERFQAQAVPIRHNNNKHFLCPIRSQHSLDRLEMVRWESVPRGSSAHAWKLSSRLNLARLIAPGSPRMHPYPGGIVGSFIHKFVCCLWMSKTVIFKLFFFSKLALLLALAGEKWILLFRQKIWRENQASPLSLSVQQAVMFCLVHKVLCTCRTVVSWQSCSWNVQWNPALRPPRL